jgi:hypothetical protein
LNANELSLGFIFKNQSHLDEKTEGT